MELNLGDTGLTYKVCKEVAIALGLNNGLARLSLASNSLGRGVEDIITNLGEFEFLEFLNLSDNNIPGRLMKETYVDSFIRNKSKNVHGTQIQLKRIEGFTGDMLYA